MYSVRCRFAPSPTGDIHLGGLRTALYNFLFSRKMNGKFVLRIEDTDQSKRLYIYSTIAKDLINKGYAYKCYCTKSRLESLRTGLSDDIIYDRHCLKLSKALDNQNHNEPYSIRIISPDKGYNNKKIPDFIIMKSDGWPTYHFANVVDDHFMHITHVLRGAEWIPSLDKHLMLYKILNWIPPTIIHLPLLIRDNGSKLSKRDSDVSIDYYKKKGYLPQALINHLTFLGWSSTKSINEIMTMNEMIRNFDIKSINKSPSKMSIDKLNWFNRKHISLVINNDHDRTHNILMEQLKYSLSKYIQYYLCNQNNFVVFGKYKIDQLYMMEQMNIFINNRVNTISQIPSFADYLFIDPITLKDEWKAIVIRFNIIAPCNLQNENLTKDLFINNFHERLNNILEKDFSFTLLEENIRKFGKDMICRDPNYTMQSVFIMIRYIITGTNIGASIIKTMELLGKKIVINRINNIMMLK